MADFSAKDVQKLRQMTGAGMMDCKKAMTSAGGDIDVAAEAIRKESGAKADKKAGRDMSQGWIGHYVHNNGRIGVLVEVSCETDFSAKNDKFQEFIKDLAMQITAMNPQAIDSTGIDPAAIEKERAFFMEEVKDKPENMQEKIVDGKMKKWFKEVCLLDQPFVKDDKKTIADLLKELIAVVGENMQIRRFVRYELGEE